MATFSESYDDAKDPGFQKRVTIAMYKQAQIIADESTAGRGEKEYAKRQELARLVKASAPGLVDGFALSVCSGGIVTTESPDMDIEFTVREQWNAFAGVTALDKQPQL